MYLYIIFVLTMKVLINNNFHTLACHSNFKYFKFSALYLKLKCFMATSGLT